MTVWCRQLSIWVYTVCYFPNAYSYITIHDNKALSLLKDKIKSIDGITFGLIGPTQSVEPKFWKRLHFKDGITFGLIGLKKSVEPKFWKILHFKDGIISGLTGLTQSVEPKFWKRLHFKECTKIVSRNVMVYISISSTITVIKWVNHKLCSSIRTTLIWVPLVKPRKVQEQVIWESINCNYFNHLKALIKISFKEKKTKFTLIAPHMRLPSLQRRRKIDKRKVYTGFEHYSDSFCYHLICVNFSLN